MSGFEVAGVVLGAVPIIIESLEAYNEVRSFIDIYRTKTEKIAALIQDLTYYQFSITEQVGKVLHGAGIHVSEAQLRSGEAAEKMENSLKGDKISRHLGMERFNLFSHQLHLCQAELAGLALLFEGLIAKPKEQDTSDGYDILKRLVIMNRLSDEPLWKGAGKRLKFSYKKADIEAKVSKLGRAVDRLKDPDLQAPSAFVFADMTPGEVSSKALKSLVKSFEIVQRQAAKLYGALITALPRSCHHSHSIRLFLDERTGPLQHRRTKPKFKVELLGFHSSGIIDTWHKCDIPADWDDGDDNDSVQQSAARQSVTFAVTATTPTLERVTEFCMCLQTVTARQMALQLQLSSHGGLCYSECMTASLVRYQTTHPGGRPCVTLDQIIRRATEPGSPEKNWTLKHRMVLALRLTCTVMQLNRTHWLARRCTSSTISFERTTRAPTEFIPGAPPPFEADEPFISKSDPTPGFNGEQPDHWAQVLVLDLAILLMELWTVTTFQQRYNLQDHGEPWNYDERWKQANKWLAELESDPRQNMLPDYVYAIQRCIEITSRQYSFEDPKFRMIFCEGVVKPLFGHCKEWLQ